MRARGRTAARARPSGEGADPRAAQKVPRRGPWVGATEMSASAGSAGVLLGSRGRGAPPTEARRHTWRQAPTPPATGRRSLFIFRGAGPSRHAPVARGSRDAAPLLPSHARGRGAAGCGGTATFLAGRRIAGRTPDRVPGAAAVHLMRRRGPRTVGCQLLADADTRSGAPSRSRWTVRTGE